MPDLVHEAIDFLGYWGIGLLMIVLAPELVMPLAGFLAGEGLLSPVAVVVVGSTGAVSGLVALYGLGRGLGEERSRRFLARYGHRLLLTERDFDAVARAFRARGAALVLLGRFIPTVRSVISVPAALVGMPFGRYLLLTATGTVIWNVVLVAAAFAFAAHRQRLLAAVEAYELAVGVGLLVLVAFVVLRRLRSRLLPDYGGEPEGEEDPPEEGRGPPGGAHPSTRSNRMS